MKKVVPASILIAMTMLVAGSVLADALPYGSYQDSCDSISFDGKTLCARCEKTNGASHDTCLTWPNLCRGGDIANKNGVLMCQWEPPS